MAMLIARGVDSSHLSTVAIGKAQPIAPNSTEDGRARNRRVEFLISGSQQANLAVIADREIKGGFFRTEANGPATLPIATDVQVLKPVGRSNSLGDLDLLQPVALLPLRAPLPDDGADLRQAGLAMLPPLPPRPEKARVGFGQNSSSKSVSRTPSPYTAASRARCALRPTTGAYARSPPTL